MPIKMFGKNGGRGCGSEQVPLIFQIDVMALICIGTKRKFSTWYWPDYL